MIIANKKFSYNDLSIVPSVISSINSRSEVTSTYADGMYPIFASPMTCVLSEHNMDFFKKNGVIPILPRQKDNLYNRIINFGFKGDNWVAVSRKEFEEELDYIVLEKTPIQGTLKILIDIANGHMLSVLESIKTKKALYKEHGINLVVMYGNVANPQTYLEYARYGVDYIRCGIGGGNCCITSSNCSVHYAMASLIYETALIKKQVEIEMISAKKRNEESGLLSLPKIVADGGIRNYSNAIMALALGADFVMIGSLFGGFIESNGAFENVFENPFFNEHFGLESMTVYLDKKLPNDYDCMRKHFTITAAYKYDIPYGVLRYDERLKRLLVDNYALRKEIYGMSTRKAQQEISNGATKTSEGVIKTIKCEYTLKQWLNNFDAYLRSAMSYCNKKDLNAFIGNVEIIELSASEQGAVNK